jgi:hypothetical protein
MRGWARTTAVHQESGWRRHSLAATSGRALPCPVVGAGGRAPTRPPPPPPPHIWPLRRRLRCRPNRTPTSGAMSEAPRARRDDQSVEPGRGAPSPDSPVQRSAGRTAPGSVVPRRPGTGGRRGIVGGMKRALLGPVAALAAVAVHDLLQREHTLLRNFPVLVTPGTCWRRSVPSCGSTWSPATTRRGPSPGTSADGSTPRRRRRTTTSASGPTTMSSTPRAIRSSSTAPSGGPSRRPARPQGMRWSCHAPRCSVQPAAEHGRSVRTRW